MNNAVRWFRTATGLQRAIVVAAAAVVGIVVLAALGRVLEGVLAAALVLFVIGLCALPFVLVGFAVYGVAQLFKGRDGAARASAGTPPAASGFVGDGPAHPHTGGPSGRGGDPAPAVDLPAGVAATVARIRAKARSLQAPEQAALLTADDRQRIESMIGEFLPQALATYRSLPTGSQEWEVDGDGTTPRQVLERHLKLIEDGLDAIARRVFEAGAAELVAQGRFLEETLRPRQGEELRLDGAPRAPDAASTS